MVLLHHPRGNDHWGQGHGDIFLELGEELLCHHGPCGAAAGTHPVQLFRDFLQKVVGFLHCAEIRANGDLHHVSKAQRPHGGLQFGGGGLLAVLAHKSRRHAGNDLLVPPDGLNHLKDLALIRNGGKGAVDKAHTAGDALIIIDLGPAQLVRLDGIHAAGGGAGAFDLGNCPVGTLIEAFAALDAFALVNMAVLVLVQINGVAGADVHAGVGNAALAAVRNTDLLGGAGIAGVGNDVDQRLIEILLIRGSLLNLGADGGGRAVGVQIHAQSQLDPCGDNGALQKYIVTVVSHLTGNQLIGEVTL